MIVKIAVFSPIPSASQRMAIRSKEKTSANSAQRVPQVQQETGHMLTLYTDVQVSGYLNRPPQFGYSRTADH